MRVMALMMILPSIFFHSARTSCVTLTALFELHVPPVEQRRRKRVSPLLVTERRVIDPRHQALRGQAVRRRHVVGRESTREPCQGEADGHAFRDLVRHASVPDDEDDLALARLRGRRGRRRARPRLERSQAR